MFFVCSLTLCRKQERSRWGRRRPHLQPVERAIPPSTVWRISFRGHLRRLGRKFNKTLFSFHSITGDAQLGISSEKETEAQGDHAAYPTLNQQEVARRRESLAIIWFSCSSPRRPSLGLFREHKKRTQTVPALNTGMPWASGRWL